MQTFILQEQDNLTSIINATISSTSTTPFPVTTTLEPSAAAGTCLAIVGNAYKPIYTCSIQNDAAILGLVSLTLTIVNILCIIGTGYIVLKVSC